MTHVMDVMEQIFNRVWDSRNYDSQALDFVSRRDENGGRDTVFRVDFVRMLRNETKKVCAK